MRRRPHQNAVGLSIALVALGIAGCNAIFGVESGLPREETSGSGGGGNSGGGGGSGGTGPGGGDLGACQAPAAGPYEATLDWAKSSASAYDALATGVAYGDAGDVFITGFYRQGDLQIKTDLLSHFGDGYYGDIFLARYGTDDGEPQWAKGFSAAGDQVSIDIATDKATGDLAVSGYFDTDFSFGGPTQTLVAQGYLDAFVARFDKAGEPLWSRSFGNESDQFGMKVAFDSQGNTLFLVLGAGILDFGKGAQGAIDTAAVWLSKLDPSGETLWTRYYPSGYYEGLFAGLAIDADDNIAITGMASGPNFNSQDEFLGGTDVYVIKLDPEGTYLWSRSFGGTAADDLENDAQWGACVAFDCAGDVLLGGTFRTDLALGQLKTLTSNDPPFDGNTGIGQGDVFVAKLDGATGEPVWAKAFGDAGLQFPTEIGSDASGNIVVSGTIFDDPASIGISFGGDTFPPSPPDFTDYREDFFIALLSPSGEHLVSHRFGDEFIQEGEAIVRADGKIAAAGDFYFSLFFDGTVGGQFNKDHRDFFVATFDP